MTIEIGDTYVLRCVPAGEEEWRRLLVVGAVPSADAPTEYCVQQAGVELETRDILGSTLLEDCDLEATP